MLWISIKKNSSVTKCWCAHLSFIKMRSWARVRYMTLIWTFSIAMRVRRDHHCQIPKHFWHKFDKKNNSLYFAHAYRRNIYFTHSFRPYRFDGCSSIQNVIPFVIIHLAPKKRNGFVYTYIYFCWICVCVFDFSIIFSLTQFYLVVFGKNAYGFFSPCENE